MARNTNNELLVLPGFFYYPRCNDGLEKLTDYERYTLLLNQGNYIVAASMEDPVQFGDLNCACDNGRIPTHRRAGAVIPEYGHVPIDLREVIDLKGE
mgnify:CR=1 FL=1